MDLNLNFKSISVVGLEKNTGKTETLNYLIKKLNKNRILGLTSIGIDGEKCDQVTYTSKPEIKIKENMIFATSEKHFLQKKFNAEILYVSNSKTSLGRIVIARSLENGLVLLSGPSSTYKMYEIINKIKNYNSDTVLIDGAISRLSPSSPFITESMILTTGAAVSLNQKELVKKTVHVFNLININPYKGLYSEEFKKYEEGIFYIKENNFYRLNIKTLLNIKNLNKDISEYSYKIYTTGSLTNNFIKYLIERKDTEKFEIIVKDYTKLFLSSEIFLLFLKRGGKLRVLKKPNLIAITVNPVSPQGYIMNSDNIVSDLKNYIDIPIFDVRKVD
ncbi:hypothetical protein OF820_10910 [Oceanotoga sp. DSM 15011]|uniref:lysine 5,6-aminomutase reactivase subunit KamB n=1 Tax=Oceanotoga sp. DSM 15011 TaxID=2984951 RepID=UPI0021F4C8BB|nr:hypothetical protein [Oceanotoga sp. DSM 15011]UYO99574.1 hypothetical protein OF820_10910 [Oceanotoga sp. DSM 15011]